MRWILSRRAHSIDFLALSLFDFTIRGFDMLGIRTTRAHDFRLISEAHDLTFTRSIERTLRAGLLGLVFSFVGMEGVSATDLPDGFAERQYATGLTDPTTMAFAPDPCPASGTPIHRLFVCEKEGAVRVFRNGVLQPTPFLSVAADTRGERGLDGICFDPNFAANGYVYIYYTILQAHLSLPTHNRVSRFTANPAHPDVALAGSETPIMEMDDLFASSYIHNGGGLHFGPDGKLYISAGENGISSNAQSLDTVLGKILRINPVPENPDGTNPPSTFPTDNPFYNSTTGKNKAIYILGVRNPFTFNFQPGTGRMFIDDVGAATWEEINEGVSGRNYGWPTCEGPCQPLPPGLTNPIFAYEHNPNFTPHGCAITGGAFYNPPATCSGDPPYGFPASYVGKYFFMDFCAGWIYTMDPNTIDPASPYGFHSIAPFASNIHVFATYLTVGPDRNLYYISRTDGAVYQIRYPASLAPTIGTQPADILVGQGWPATFTVAASGVPPLHYRWQRSDTDIAGAADTPSYTITNPTVANDNGAIYRCIVSNSYGNTATREAVLSVTTKQPPVPAISSPPPNTYFEAGQTFSFAGSAVDGHDIVTHDPQDGVLGPNAFTWQILFEHHLFSNPNHHTHPFFPPTSGIAGGTFTIPTSGETDPDTWYRIIFTAQDSYGLSTTIFRDIFPRRVHLGLTTTPVLFPVKLDGSPKQAPYDLWSVVHMIRNIGVDSPQIVNGLIYDFASWSDHGARFHNISAPRTSTSYIAHFWKRPGYGNITANPNPIQVTDGTGKGATTLLWSSGQTNKVEVHVGSPAGGLLARSGPGTFSQLTNNVIRDATKIYLQDVSNNQPLTSLYTLDSVTLHVTTASVGSITANPNPFLPDQNGLGQTTVAWTSNVVSRAEVHINSPDGPGLAGSNPGTFSVPTGHWVTDGMTFYLQDVSNGRPLTSANTLATVTMRARRPPTGSISAQPNPFAPNPQGLGRTTLTWTSTGTNRVEIHVNAPNGNLLTGSGPGSFSATTGQWVRNGMTFYLQNVSAGLPLTSGNTLATVTMTASP
jgi:glucose/arabinose dehydrogenase